MSEVAEAFLHKSAESLAGAESEFLNGRYNNAANRAYYACFQAAIAALDGASIRPSGRKSEWGHDFVQSQFAGVLIHRRKRYPTALRGALGEMHALREQGDYQLADVSRIQAARALVVAREFVAAVMEREQGDNT